MAFYTSRVDNEGNELERRQSVRSIGQSIYSNLNPSITSSNTFLPSARSLGQKSSVRYVNPAAFIEKSSNEDGDESVTSDDLTIKSSSSHIVPSIDIHSEESSATNHEYMREIPRLSSHDAAYNNWLSAKKKLKTIKEVENRKLEEQKKIEKAERQKLAEQKFQEWMERKMSQQQIQQTVKTFEEQDRTSSGASVYGTRSQISSEEARIRVKEWERKKLLEEKSKREMERAEEERRKQWEKKRHRQSAEAWKRWVADAASKPKPVPLNRGIFTLRGTVSDIFVNPNEWQQLNQQTSK